MVHWYHDDYEEISQTLCRGASANGRAHGEATAEGAQGPGRISRFDAGRPARRYRPARVRWQNGLSESFAATHQGIKEVLWPRSRLPGQPSADRRARGQAQAKDE